MKKIMLSLFAVAALAFLPWWPGAPFLGALGSFGCAAQNWGCACLSGSARRPHRPAVHVSGQIRPCAVHERGSCSGVRQRLLWAHCAQESVDEGVGGAG